MTHTDQDYLTIAITEFLKVEHHRLEHTGRPDEGRSTVTTDIPDCGPVVVLRGADGKLIETYYLTEQDDGTYKAFPESFVYDGVYQDEVPADFTRRIRELQGDS